MLSDGQRHRLSRSPVFVSLIASCFFPGDIVQKKSRHHGKTVWLFFVSEQRYLVEEEVQKENYREEM